MMIRELMTGGLITVRHETSVQQARDLLAKEGIRHLPVTGPGGVLAGIVTDRDIRSTSPRGPPACRRRRSPICSPG